MTKRIHEMHAGSSRPWLPTLLLACCVVAGLSAGCDERDWKGKDEAATPAEVKDPRTAANAKAIASYTQCYDGCYKAHTNETNRETCKLECDGLAEIGMGALADPASRAVYDHLHGCVVGCWDDHKLSETNRSTCLLTCSDDAEVAAAPPPKHNLEVVPGTVLAPGTPLPPGVQPPPPK